MITQRQVASGAAEGGSDVVGTSDQRQQCCFRLDQLSNKCSSKFCWHQLCDAWEQGELVCSMQQLCMLSTDRLAGGTNIVMYKGLDAASGLPFIMQMHHGMHCGAGCLAGCGTATRGGFLCM